MEKIASDYFTNGEPALEAGIACDHDVIDCDIIDYGVINHDIIDHDVIVCTYIAPVCYSINQWPYPRPGHVIHLPLMGELIYIRIPSKADKPSAAKILANFPAVKSAVSNLHH